MSHLELTRVHRELLGFIASHISEKGYPPSVRDAAEAIGRNPSTTHFALRRLRERGLLGQVDGIPRSVTITPEGMKLLGRVELSEGL